MATGTYSPNPFYQFFDDNGDPLASGKLYTYAAGTSTPLATYSNVTLTSANANPIILDSAGRCTIFLAATSYKFVLKTSADVTVATRDNVGQVPLTAIDNDVTGTAAEALTATQVAYLNTSGTWNKADADAAASGTVPPIGFVVSDIANGDSGTFRITGRMTGFSGLTPGADYFVSTTAGSITSSAPANARYVGRADSISSLIIPTPRPAIYPQAPQGRLTLTSGTPVTTADVTAATTLYFAPYLGNTAWLYDGSNWAPYTFSQLSIAVPSTTNQMYDVFLYNNAGTLTLELLAWTNDTTRATALTTQNGVYVKTGATTRLYLGSFRTTGVSGQTEDSATKRYLFNYYWRVPRQLQRYESTASWTYTTATVRQANGSTSNQVDVVIGAAEVPIDLTLNVLTSNSTGGIGATAGIGEDSTTTYVDGAYMQGAAGVPTPGTVRVVKFPAVGKHSYSWNEWSTATGTSTWFGSIAAVGSTVQFGLSGTVMQ